MTKYTNFRIIYLNLNIICIILSLFLFFKCSFNKIIKGEVDESHKKLCALGIIATIHGLIAGYIGCQSVWFRSKLWTQMQILVNLLMTPFLILAYIIERIRRGDMDNHQDQICEYVILSLFALDFALTFLSYKFLNVLRNESKPETNKSKEAAIDFMAMTPRSSTPMNSFVITGSVPSLFESHWNLAPFGRLNGLQNIGSLRSVVSHPSINLLIDPKQLQIKDKDSIPETHV